MRVTYALVILVLAASCIVLPNSVKNLSAVMMVLSALLSGISGSPSRGSGTLWRFWLLSVLVTLFYLAVGAAQGAPAEAANQILIIYIVSPALWLIIIDRCLSTWGLDVVVRCVKLFGVVGALSVFYFFYKYLDGGPEAVEFFIEEPNVDVSKDGSIAGTMYVYGSLIFVTGGFVASFRPLAASVVDYLMLLLFAVVALISGRGALILSLFIGLAVQVVTSRAVGARTSIWTIARNVGIGVFCVTIVSRVFAYFDLDLLAMIDPLLEKLQSFGGDGRNPQMFALLDGVGDRYGFGAGHGISASYTVDPRYPWRYEMVWIASIFRVGVIGAVIYAAPFFLALKKGATLALRRSLTSAEVFVLGGFAAAFVASNTNPYIEAFVFQWMYVLPLLVFLSASRQYFESPKYGS